MLSCGIHPASRACARSQGALKIYATRGPRIPMRVVTVRSTKLRSAEISARCRRQHSPKSHDRTVRCRSPTALSPLQSFGCRWDCRAPGSRCFGRRSQDSCWFSRDSKSSNGYQQELAGDSRWANHARAAQRPPPWSTDIVSRRRLCLENVPRSAGSILTVISIREHVLNMGSTVAGR